MHKRTAHRWRLTIIMVAGTFFAFGSFWLAQVLENQDPSLNADAFKNEPDYIVDKFSYVRMAADGKPRYIISGDKLTHRPVDDASDIERPFVQNVAADQPPMTINAKQARVDHANSQIHLLGDVDIERKASAGARPARLKTQALTIFPDEDQMKTDQPVQMLSDGATLTGTGLFIDNAARQVNVGGRARVVYPPAPRRK